MYAAASKYPFLFCVNLYFVNIVFADYCEFGTCEVDQYCCGENKCCKKTVEVWYLWAGILLLVIAILFMICIHIFWKKRQQKYGPYNLLNEDIKVSVS